MTVVWSALRCRLFAALTGMDKDSLEPYLDRKCNRLVSITNSWIICVPIEIRHCYRFFTLQQHLILQYWAGCCFSVYHPPVSGAWLNPSMKIRGNVKENLTFSFWLYWFIRYTNVYSLWLRHLALLIWYHLRGPQDLGLALKRVKEHFPWLQFFYSAIMEHVLKEKDIYNEHVHVCLVYFVLMGKNTAETMAGSIVISFLMCIRSIISSLTENVFVKFC